MPSEMFKIAEDSARGGFFLISGSILSTIISAIASILVARFLGPELYGQYALALVVPQILFLFADLGINQGLIRFSASLRTNGQTVRMTQLIKYGMLFRAFIGAIIFIANFAFAEYFATILLNRPDLGPYIRIASISIIFQTVFSTATSAFVGLDKTEYNALTTSMQAVAKAVVSVALVLLGLSVAGAVMGHVAGYIIAGMVGTVMLFLLLKKHSKTEEKSNFARELKILIGYGIPLYMSVLLAGFIPSYQNLILAMFTSDTDIGNLKAATNFVTLITLVSAPITTALLPAFSKLNTTSNGKTKDFFRFANKYTTLLIVPIAVLIMIFSNEIVRIIYGSTYQSASLFLLMYCPVYFLVGIGYLTLDSLFNGQGETRIVLKRTLINVSIFIVLAPLLARTNGVPGVILAFLASNAVGTFYGAYIGKIKLKIEFAGRSIIKIFLISIISSTPAILFLQLPPMPTLFHVAIRGFFNVAIGGRFFNVIVGGLVYFVTYATLTPIARVVTLSELENAAQVMEKIRLLNNFIKPLIKYQKLILSTSTRPFAARKNTQQTRISEASKEEI